eukprot:scpid73239/ scgid20346/ 
MRSCVADSEKSDGRLIVGADTNSSASDGLNHLISSCTASSYSAESGYSTIAPMPEEDFHHGSQCQWLRRSSLPSTQQQELCCTDESRHPTDRSSPTPLDKFAPPGSLAHDMVQPVAQSVCQHTTSSSCGAPLTGMRCQTSLSLEPCCREAVAMTSHITSSFDGQHPRRGGAAERRRVFNRHVKSTGDLSNCNESHASSYCQCRPRTQDSGVLSDYGYSKLVNTVSMFDMHRRAEQSCSRCSLPIHEGGSSRRGEVPERMCVHSSPSSMVVTTATGSSSSDSVSTQPLYTASPHQYVSQQQQQQYWTQGRESRHVRQRSTGNEQSHRQTYLAVLHELTSAGATQSLQ